MDCLPLLELILYMFLRLVVFSLTLLRFLLLLTVAQMQVDKAKQDRLRKQTLFNDINKPLVLKPPIKHKMELYDEPDQQKQRKPYLLQFFGHEQVFQCFAVQYTTEDFIYEALQVDSLQLDCLRDLYIEIYGTQEESVEPESLENVLRNSLLESDTDTGEPPDTVLSTNILSGTSIHNGQQDESVQTLSELLRIRTITLQQCPSIQIIHTNQSVYRNSSEVEGNSSASNYNSEGSRGALEKQHDPQVHQNMMVDDKPSQSTEVRDTERYLRSIPSEDNNSFAYEWIRLQTFSDWPQTSMFSTVLAQNGWVSLGDGDRACCYSCHVVHEGWRIGDDPVQYHSPNCRLKSGQWNNVPISQGTSSQTSTLGQFFLFATEGNEFSGNDPDPLQGELQQGLNKSQQDSLSQETSSVSEETEEITSSHINSSRNLIPNHQAKQKKTRGPGATSLT